MIRGHWTRWRSGCQGRPAGDGWLAPSVETAAGKGTKSAFADCTLNGEISTVK